MAVEPRSRVSPGWIRRAELVDHPWIVATGAEAYRDLGDYTRILPSWLEQPGVLAWIEQDSQARGRGFAMLGFYTEDARAPQVISRSCSRSPSCRRIKARASAPSSCST